MSVDQSNDVLYSIKDRVAVVTGGARGLGAAVVKRLKIAGARVAILDRSLAPDMTVNDHFIACDIADAVAVEAAFAEIDGELGPTDLLVNAAGLTVRARAIEMKISVNLTGTFTCAREAAQRMQERGGSIVNVASIMGLSGGLFPSSAYQASKGGVVNLTRALAAEWASLNIRVNAVAPTYVETDLTRTMLADPSALARIVDATPMRRLALDYEVAAAVMFLLSPASSMTTGHTLPVDGGFLAV